MDSSHALTTTETFASQAVELPRWRRMATKILNGPIISLGILAALVFVAVFADFFGTLSLQWHQPLHPRSR